MKINKIRFKNINSLRGEHEVDFTKEPLASAGLFAITGPTGSGKTTLLDVICLALFNRVPRINAAISKNLITETGSILTRNTTEAFAEVEYQCAQGLFISKWEISTARTGNLRDYGMEIADAQTLAPLSIKKSQVPATNEAHIGLNYDQFIKSIMLAQGDFAKFLQANKGERSDLLEKITGTSIYRQLGRRAFEMSSQLGTQLGQLKEKQQVYKGQLLDDETLVASKAEHKNLEKTLQEVDKQIGQWQKQIDLLQEVEKLQAQFNQLKEKKSTLDQQKQSFDAQEGKQIVRHEALIPHTQQLTDWQAARKEKGRLTAEAQQVQAELEKVAAAFAAIKLKVSALVGDFYQEDSLNNCLDEFAAGVQSLLKDRDALRNDFRTLHAGLKGLNRYGAGIDPRELEKSIAEYRAVLLVTQKEVEEFAKGLGKEQMASPHETLGLLEDKVELLKEAIPLRKTADDQLERITKIGKEQAEIAEQLEALPKQIKKLSGDRLAKAATAENLGLKLENEKLKAELETHRHHLKDGLPCPLCGALEHPFAKEEPVPETALEKDLKAALDALKKLELDYAAKVAGLALAESQKKKLIADIEPEQDKLRDQNSRLGNLLQNFTDQERDLGLEELQTQLVKARETMRGYINAQEKLAVLSEAEKEVEKLLNAYNKGKQKAAEILTLYKGEDLEKDLRSMRDTLQENRQNQKLKTERHEELNGALNVSAKSISSIETALLPSLEKLDYSSPTEAIAARLDEGAFNRLISRRNQLQQDLKLNLQESDSLQKTITEKKAHVADEAAETLNTKLQSVKDEKRTKSASFQALDRQLKNHADNLAVVERLQKTILAKEKSGKKWVLLNEYIGDAQGKRFNDFAQDLTLSQLIVLANRRLRSLNDRYLLDKAKTGEDDSLMIIDAHMGNERRSVKTLSGGETFILSLALALALSDLASRNVEINSLFIDEGFGTLDPETLDQTLDTLEKLQSEGGKTIGIISHVEALKERINTQIQLVRNGQGFSSLQVK